jgi:adenylate kinase family enzyme
MDGNFSETFDLRMPRADTLVWLDYPRSTCLRRVMLRSLRDYGRRRPDLPAGCPEQIDMKLLRWVWDFPLKQRPRIVAGIERFGGHLRVTRIENDRAAGDFLATVKATA